VQCCSKLSDVEKQHLTKCVWEYKLPHQQRAVSWKIRVKGVLWVRGME